MNMASLAGKVALITGASSGIGAATAELFAKHGAILALTGRNIQNLKATADKCKSFTPKTAPLLIQGDVSVEDLCHQIIEDTIAKFDKLDILVNNAGVWEIGSIEDTSMAQYDAVMNTNLRAVYNLTMLAVPHLIATKGNIVNVSSVNGIRSSPGGLAYNISKAAVDHLTRCVALELALKGIRVNGVNAGVIDTQLFKKGGLDDDTNAIVLEHAKTTHALGRPGDVKEVAKAIAFLASDDASYSTGVSLPVDGGRHAMCSR